MKRLLILTSAILLLAAACNKQSAVGPAPVPQPVAQNNSTNQTANWKIYTNTQLEFTINVPADWIIIDDKTYKDLVCFASPQKTKDLKSPNYEGTCGELVFGTKSYISNATPGSQKDITLSNNTFTYYQGGAAYENASYVINHNNVSYNFETIGGTLVEQILSTFKFTK